MIAVAEYKRLSVEEIGDLVTRFRNGDSAAGWDIVLSCRPWIKRLARQASDHCGGDAEDLAQELTVLVYRTLPKYDPQKGSLVNFIHMIAKRRLGRVTAQLQGTELGGTAGQLDLSADDLSAQSYEPEAPIDERQAMFAELNEVCHDVPPIGIAALRYKYLDELSKGACVKRLLSDFPEAFGEVLTGSRQAYVDDIANESLKQLQESLGIVSPQPDGEVADRWSPKAEYQRDPQAGLPLPIELRAAIIEYARQNPKQNSAAIQREFTRLGKKVSTTTVRSVLAASGLARRKARGATAPEQAEKTSNLREAIIECALEHSPCAAATIHSELCKRGRTVSIDLVRRTLAGNGLARTASELRAEIVEYAKQHPAYSVGAIRAQFLQRGESVSTKDVRQILTERGLVRGRCQSISVELREAIVKYALEHPSHSATAIRVAFRRRGESINVKAVRQILDESGLKPVGTKPESREAILECARLQPSWAAVAIKDDLWQRGICVSVKVVQRTLAANGLSRRKACCGHETPADLREAIVGLAEANPSYSSRTIFNELCSRGYKLHVRTVRRILAAHGLARSKASHGTETSPELREAIIRIAKQHPLKSATEIHTELCRRGEKVGCAATVRNILAANGLSRAKIRGLLRHKAHIQDALPVKAT